MYINNPFQDRNFSEYQIRSGKAKTIEYIDQQIIYVYPLFKGYTILYTNKNNPKLNQLAKKHKAIYTLIENTKSTTKQNHHKQIKEIIPRFTRVIELEKDEQSILQQMHQKGRYNIRLAKKKGVEIKESKDIDSFYEMLQKTARRDKFQINPKQFYKEMLETLSSQKKAKLFLAYHPDSETPIAGILNTYIKDTATYYYGASDHHFRKYMAPYLLQWHAIQDAKKNEFKIYDFLGVANPVNPKDSLQGVSRFKSKFGGKVIQYENSQILIHKPLLFLLLRVRNYLLRR